MRTPWLGARPPIAPCLQLGLLATIRGSASERQISFLPQRLAQSLVLPELWEGSWVMRVCCCRGLFCRGFQQVLRLGWARFWLHSAGELQDEKESWLIGELWLIVC